MEALFLQTCCEMVTDSESLFRSEVKRVERIERDQIRTLKDACNRFLYRNRQRRYFSTQPLTTLPPPFLLLTSTRVWISNIVITHNGPIFDEEDFDFYLSGYKTTIEPATAVKCMVSKSLKNRFGGDSADPESWISKVEEYSWLDDIYMEVKDFYQSLYNEEATARILLILKGGEKVQ